VAPPPGMPGVPHAGVLPEKRVSGTWTGGLVGGVCQLVRLRHAQQGVVTYTSFVEAFATGIKNLDRRKSSLIA